MRLHILSDLHLRQSAFAPPTTDADVVILAGDIARNDAGITWATQQFAGRPMLYVLGNHEFYHGVFQDTYAVCAQAANDSGQDIHVLQDSEWLLGNVAFLGATLWTDFELFGMGMQAEAMTSASKRAADYRVIQIRGDAGELRALQPIDTIRACATSFEWLKARVAAHHQAGRKVCVVTHHAPARGSLSPRHADDPLSAYFVSAFDDWIAQAGPELWIHGHTHEHFDYQVGHTRVVCNARGYPKEQEGDGHGFDPGLVVTL